MAQMMGMEIDNSNIRHLLKKFIEYLVSNIASNDFKFLHESEGQFTVLDDMYYSKTLMIQLDSLETSKIIVFDDYSFGWILPLLSLIELKILIARNKKVMDVIRTRDYLLSDYVKEGSNDIIKFLVEHKAVINWYCFRNYGTRKDFSFREKVKMLEFLKLKSYSHPELCEVSNIVSFLSEDESIQNKIEEFKVYLKIFELDCQDFSRSLGTIFLTQGLWLVEYIIENGAQCTFVDNLVAILRNKDINKKSIRSEQEILELLDFISSKGIEMKSILWTVNNRDTLFDRNTASTEISNALLEGNNFKIFQKAHEVLGFYITKPFLENLLTKRGEYSVSKKVVSKIVKYLCSINLLNSSSINYFFKYSSEFDCPKDFDVRVANTSYIKDLLDKNKYREPKFYDLVFNS